MKGLRKIISPILVLLILFSNFQLPYLKSHMSPQVYGAENPSNTFLSAVPTTGADSSTVTTAVYDTGDDSMTDEEAVALDGAWLTEDLLLSGNNSLSSVTENVYLPNNGPNGSVIRWESNDETVVALDGTVTRPNHNQEVREVTLTATISKGYAENEKIFTVTVTAMDPLDTALAVKYDDFSDIGNSLKFNGEASVYKLTTYGEPNLDFHTVRLASDYNQGGNFFTRKQIHLPDNMSFSTYFEFLVLAGMESGGWGEGLTFTLQAADNDVFINHGPSMGTLGIKPSLSIEFDTNPQDDPSENTEQHTAVFLNGNYDSPEVLAALPYEIREGQIYRNYHVWIEYDGTSDTLEMRISDINQRPESAIITANNLDLGDVFTTEDGSLIKDIYAGFTANTNAESKDEHYIMQWHFKNDAIPIETDTNPYIDASSISLAPEPVVGGASSIIKATLYERDFNKPVDGVAIDFFTSFGSLDPSSVITDADGNASVALSSDTSGTAVVKAIAQGGAFTTTEVQLDNPVGDVAADKTWLTDERVLNGNSALNNVTVNLAMPKEGEYGSTINWESSNEEVVTTDGTVTRPSYIEGDQEITLTATISKGDVVEVKTFTVTVKALYQTDAEAVAADMEWLTVSRTLGANGSQYSIRDNLILPMSAPNGSSIIWQSSMPTVISNRGDVNRPKYPNHQSVIMTADLKKGNKQESKEFLYTVLAESDTKPPYITDTNPQHNSEAVPFDNRQITVTFNENIKQGSHWNEMKVGYLEMVRNGSEAWEQKFIEVESFFRIDNNKLMVTLNGDMKSLRYYKLIIPENAITDSSGNNISSEFTLRYKVEMIKTGELQVTDSNPSDRQENVSAEINQMVFSYSDMDIFEGSTFNDISLLNRFNEAIPILREVNGNTVTLRLEPGTKLQLGEAYHIYIPSGAVQDRFKRKSKWETIQFKMRAEDVAPEISSIYPVNEMYGSNVHQSVDISFSEKVKADYAQIMLLDDKGNRVPAKTFLYNNDTGMVIDPIEGLKPQTTYTVLLPENAVWDYSANTLGSQYKIYFTTGSDSLNMDMVNISHRERDVRLDTPIQIHFSSPVTRGPEFSNIKITDSQGDPVPFQSQESDNEVILKPNGGLEPSETYTVDIPRGAYININNDTNDIFKMKFTTASPLETKDTFLVKPSPYYFTNSTLTFSAVGIENTFKNLGREITSYEWTFSDGTKQSEKTAEHTYTEAGNYLVTLDITDNKGIFYEYKETITIMDYPSDSDISVTPRENKRVLKSNDSTKDVISYEFNASYKGIPLTGRKVRVLLYKNNNNLHKDFGDVITDTDGKATFKLNYHNLSGIYELAFLYGENGEGKEIRCPISIYDMSDDLSLWIGLREGLGRNEHSFNWPSIEVEVDGESKTAEKWGMGYMISGISSGTHEIQVFSESFYPSDKKVLTLFEDTAAYILVEKIVPSEKPVICYIKSDSDIYYSETDSRDSRDKIYIKGKSSPYIFTVVGDWKGHRPGYLEYKSVAGIPGKTFSIAALGSDLNTRILMHTHEFSPGGRLAVRMVSEDGVASPWVDAKFEIAPPFSPLESSMEIPGIMAGKIPVLENIPLLDGDKSFGIDGGNYGLYPPFIDDYGKQTFVFFQNRHIYNSTSLQITGYIGGNLAYQYYPDLDDWRFAQGTVSAGATGTRTLKKDYDFPVLSKIPGFKYLDFGPYVKLITKADVAGTFIVNSDTIGKKDYQGIIYFAPDVELVAGAGNDQLNIEGYGGGNIKTQVHLPTKYVQVDPSLRVGFRYTFLGFKGDLFSAEATTSWNNGKEKIPAIMANAVSQPLMMILGTDDVELKPMSRDYLNRESHWLAGSQAGGTYQRGIMSAVLADETNPQIENMKDNIYPDADVELVSNGDELWMVWTDDNSDRDPMNRTQLRYAVLKDGTWSEPVWIGHDKTADFSPVSASTGNGVLMAWQNIKNKMGKDSEIGDFIKNSEISVTERVYKVGSSDVQIVTLTDDDKFDHSPKLAGDGDNGLLVWTKSVGMALSDMEVPENSDRLFFSRWNGSTWSDPEEIANSLPTVINSSLTMNGKEGLLLYTLNMGGAARQKKQEIFARVYDGNSWTEEIKITENQVSPSNPKAVYCNGEWFLTWYADGGIMYKKGLDGETKTAEFLSKVQHDYDMVVKEGRKPQIALVYKQRGYNSVQTLSTSFYDIEKDIWSDEIPLTEGEGYVRSASPAFTEDGKLNVAYTQAKVIMEVIEDVEYKKPSDIVDLHRLIYTPIQDLALHEEDGLQLSYENPVPGARVKVTANIRNQGDFPENAMIDLYDGNPEKGGTKIGEASTTQPIPARSSAPVEVEWLVDLEEKERYDIYAVVDPDNAISEFDENNNRIKHEIICADIGITDLKCENIAKNDYLVTATVANRGSRLLEGIKVYLDHNLREQPLETKDLEKLEPGQEVSLIFVFSSDGLTKDENGEINMTLNALLPDGIEEFSTENNTYAFNLELTPMVVNSMEPLDGTTQVDIQQPLTLGFNMNLEQGEGFDQIILEDEFLNEIDISKTLEGNTLTVTPKTPMAYNTQYTLTIPREAVGDSYGHTMVDAYRLGFVTTTSSPEVIFAYPGDGMGDVALDNDIKMKFNQHILEGVTLDEVVLYGPSFHEIPASVSLEGEWLYINPAENLDQNTSYSLLIPAGAVQNDRGEVLQNDYSLEFHTGQGVEEGNNNDSGNSGKDHSSNVSNLGQQAYRITRQTFEDGSSMAIVHIDGQSILKLKSGDEVEVIINVTDGVKEDEIIQINLTESAVKQLLTDQMGLNVVTGKGDVRLPAELIKSLVGEGENPMAITIVEKDGMENDYERVSSIYDISITVGGQQVTEFEGEVIITIPIAIAGVGNPKRVIVCVYNEDKDSWQPVGGVANIKDGTITFKAGHFSTFSAFETIKHFDDVTSDWAKEKVEILASRRLINGKTDNEFAPEDSITRAEFTALIVRSLYTELLGSRGTFIDVSEDAWFADSVETAYEMGLINGSGNSKFDPNAQITREQLATIAYRLYQYKTGTETINKMNNRFIDRHDISSYAEEAVNFVADTEIMLGSGGRFEPKRSATRQETAVVLYRLLVYMGEL